VFLQSDGVSVEVAEGDLVAVVREMDSEARNMLLLGLLRPDKLLIGGYSAPNRRCCPLTAAVWEAHGRQATHWDDILSEIQRIGFKDHQRFTAAYDRWARACGYERVDRDRMLFLSREGRLRLVALVEGVVKDADPAVAQSRRRRFPRRLVPSAR
jgi:hypothetical protein